MAMLLTALALATGGCSPDHKTPLRVFHAAGLTPLLDQIRHEAEASLNLRLLTEASGSQMACRKISELGRSCDLLMLADAALVAELLPNACAWRIDFATDAMVIAVGARAPEVGAAEQDWLPVLLEPTTRLARVDENLGPIGYRTLLCWKLAAEQRRDQHPDLYERLLANTTQLTDHVASLMPLLKTGEADYAFVYRSICIANDLRYIELPPEINLSQPDFDYSSAEISFTKLKAGTSEQVRMRGQPILWTLAIPQDAAQPEAARQLINLILQHKSTCLDAAGFIALPTPTFHGTQANYRQFAQVTTFAGALER